MNRTEEHRLASIRADQMKWEALRDDAKNWDVAICLRVIDAQNEELRRLKKGKA